MNSVNQIGTHRRVYDVTVTFRGSNDGRVQYDSPKSTSVFFGGVYQMSLLKFSPITLEMF